jgi:hypothetical protein
MVIYPVSLMDGCRFRVCPGSSSAEVAYGGEREADEYEQSDERDHND